jgi:polysaccharide pyruvyl transferase WcaK-like protein
MKILVLHAWLKGNLGDVLQLSVLLSALRNLEPHTLDLAGFPPRPAPETHEVLSLADRYLPDTFPWYWAVAPSVAGRLLFEPWWTARRRSLFSRYDAIVCAPGPYLADYDPRVTSALCDLAVAGELRRPVVLASHSIGPLGPKGLSIVNHTTLRIAREATTHRYLHERGISAVLSADLAFLYPYAPRATRAGRQTRLVFLRSNNLDVRRLRLAEDGALVHGSQLIVSASPEPLVLATSDHRRDGRFLARVARRLGVPWIPCRSVQEMVDLVDSASEVVSDRYHPAICAAALGKPARVIENREPHKMRGLQSLLAERPLQDLQELARTGLRILSTTLRSHV